MDDTYQVYVNRVARMTLPEAYQSQVQYIQPSPKYERHGNGESKPAPFPGYTIITPPCGEDSKNAGFYDRLQQCQQQVLEQLEPGLMIPVPPDSFHFTLGDLIWASAYRDAIADPTFEPQLQERVARSFQKAESLVQSGKPIYWQVIGFFLRTRALGVCLAPREEDSYNRVVALRRTIYQNPDVIALGIEQQYNFTAHITLGYFGDVATTTDRDRLSETLVDLNHQWIGSDAIHEIWVHRAELRKFDDMTRYYRQPDWPILEF